MKDKMDRLRFQLGQMQRTAYELQIPLVVVFESLDVWGMADGVNRFVRCLDPRGCDVHYTMAPTPAEKERPFICRFFNCMPARGRVAVFDQSWYFWLVYDYYRSGDKKRAKKRMEEIRMMERQHVRQGWVILKFFLEVKKKELRRRWEEDPKEPCRGDFRMAGDEFIKDYEDVLELWKEVLQENDILCAPWHWVRADDEEVGSMEVMEKVIMEMDPILQGSMGTCRAGLETKAPSPLPPSNVLAEVDLSTHMPLETYKEKLNQLQRRLDQAQCDCFKKRIPTIIVFEGWDAAGKGGNILRLTAPLNPRGYKVIPVGAPSQDEIRHHHLWRFYRDFPLDGRIAIFDRSWYGRVLVERVEGLASSEEWNWAYEEISEMERMLTGHGCNLIKFWLHIDKAEQGRRFKERESNESKSWKLTPEDIRNRERWDDYVPAIEEMIARTSTKDAPWHVVPSNDKRYARTFVLEKVVQAMEKGAK